MPASSGRSVDGDSLESVCRFLASTLPFDSLDDAPLKDLSARLRIHYYPRGETISWDDAGDGLRILRSGAVDLRDAGDTLVDRLGEGESFHLGGLNSERRGVSARVIEDSLVYRLPDEHYLALRARNRHIDRYFHAQRSRRLRRAARYRSEPDPLLQSLASVMTPEVLTVTPTTATVEVARAMTERRVSSAFIVDAGRLVGIVTDRDLRSRLVAAGAGADRPVGEFMTHEPLTIDRDATVFDASLLMTRQHLHHLPVVDGDALVGVFTSSDLLVLRGDDPVTLVQRIGRQQDVAGMQALLAQVPELVRRWVAGGQAAVQVTRILSSFADAVTRRLIELAEASLGPAPMRWCWLCFGSLARNESLLGPDQDNGIIMESEPDERARAWFSELATFVCDGLAEAGFRYCPGGIMATNEAWRLPLDAWERCVRGWARTPTPDAVMRVSIFFDLRPVYGDLALARALQGSMLSAASGSSIFLAALADNALQTPAPLGLFRRFLVERSGEHRDELDLKKRAALPITDIARLHALAHGFEAVGTGPRLEALGRAGKLSLSESRDYSDALECVQRLRLRHQSDCVAEGRDPDNFVNPSRLSRLQREQLRDAFTIVHRAQEGARQRFRAGLS